MAISQSDLFLFMARSSLTICSSCRNQFPVSLLVGGICRPCLAGAGANEALFDSDFKAETIEQIKEQLPNKRALTEIIRKIARFDTPAQIIREVQEKYKIRFTVEHLNIIIEDAGCKAQYMRYRNEFLHETHEVPIAHKVVRLNRLEQAYHDAVAIGNLQRAIEAIESARTEIEGRRIKIKNETKHSLLALVAKVNMPEKNQAKALPSESGQILTRLANRKIEVARVGEE